VPRKLDGDISDRDGIEPGKEDGGVPDPRGLAPEESELLASGNHCGSERGSVIAVAASVRICSGRVAASHCPPPEAYGRV